MKIGDIKGFNPQLAKLTEINKSKDDSFGEMFTDFVKGVNGDQKDSIKMTEDFITGKDVELHEVMVSSQKAKTSLDLLMELRNKSLDMYNELTRMQ
ncbi:MAG: flagellar hook-basal body complex protein FliE [Melioribacteraceae bacterium]|nr:flagellar hook-basal body complex protein FliE [Melioribacteraceae bacterium]